MRVVIAGVAVSIAVAAIFVFRPEPAEQADNWVRDQIAAAVLVPAFAVLVAMLAREPVRVPRPEANARPTAAEETAALTAMPAPEVSASHPRLAAHRAVRAVPRPSAERIADGNAAGVVIRIETPDPNVVILLVGG